MRVRWWARSLLDRWRADNVSLVAGGVAFYSLFSFLPATVVLASLYGMLAGSEPVSFPETGPLAALPPDVRELLANQLDAIRRAPGAGLTAAAVIGVVVSLWSASSAIKQLVVAVNLIVTGQERRSFVRLRLLGAGLPGGLLAVLAVALTLTAVVPVLVAGADLPRWAEALIDLIRWPLLGLATMLLFAVLARVGPERPPAPFRLVTAGSLTAAVVWLVASVGFSSFVADSARYRAAYGSLVGAAVTLVWFWLFAAALLVGTQVDVLRARGGHAAG